MQNNCEIGHLDMQSEESRISPGGWYLESVNFHLMKNVSGKVERQPARESMEND